MLMQNFPNPNESYSGTFQGLSKTTSLLKIFKGLKFVTFKFRHFKDLGVP